MGFTVPVDQIRDGDFSLLRLLTGELARCLGVQERVSAGRERGDDRYKIVATLAEDLERGVPPRVLYLKADYLRPGPLAGPDVVRLSMTVARADRDIHQTERYVVAVSYKLERGNFLAKKELWRPGETSEHLPITALFRGGAQPGERPSVIRLGGETVYGFREGTVTHEVLGIPRFPAGSEFEEVIPRLVVETADPLFIGGSGSRFQWLGDFFRPANQLYGPFPALAAIFLAIGAVGLFVSRHQENS